MHSYNSRLLLLDNSGRRCMLPSVLLGSIDSSHAYETVRVSLHIIVHWTCLETIHPRNVATSNIFYPLGPWFNLSPCLLQDHFRLKATARSPSVIWADSFHNRVGIGAQRCHSLRFSIKRFTCIKHTVPFNFFWRIFTSNVRFGVTVMTPLWFQFPLSDVFQKSISCFFLDSHSVPCEGYVYLSAWGFANVVRFLLLRSPCDLPHFFPFN